MSDSKEEYQNGLQDKRLDSLECKIDTIMSNHLPHIQKSLESVSTDLRWIKKFFWITVTASITSLLAVVAQLILKIIKY